MEATGTMTPAQIVSHNLKREREERGWTQERLAAELEPFIGARWSRQTSSAAERGGRTFAIGEVIALARTLQIPADVLLLPPTGLEYVKHPSGHLQDVQSYTAETLATDHDALQQRLQELALEQQLAALRARRGDRGELTVTRAEKS